jgi:hypothetical protein
MLEDDKYLNQKGVDFFVQPGLLEMKWEVPDYETKKRKVEKFLLQVFSADW